MNCSFTERIEWIALAVAVNLVGSRYLSDSKPVRSVIFLGRKLNFSLTEE